MFGFPRSSGEFIAHDVTRRTPTVKIYLTYKCRGYTSANEPVLAIRELLQVSSTLGGYSHTLSIIVGIVQLGILTEGLDSSAIGCYRLPALVRCLRVTSPNSRSCNGLPSSRYDSVSRMFYEAGILQPASFPVHDLHTRRAVKAWMEVKQKHRSC